MGWGWFWFLFPTKPFTPWYRSCSWDNCSFLFVPLIYLLILLKWKFLGQGLSLPCWLCGSPDISDVCLGFSGISGCCHKTIGILKSQGVKGWNGIHRIYSKCKWVRTGSAAELSCKETNLAGLGRLLLFALLDTLFHLRAFHSSGHRGGSEHRLKCLNAPGFCPFRWFGICCA